MIDLPRIHGREAIPVRLLTIISALPSDSVAMLFAGRHPLHRWKLLSYQLDPNDGTVSRISQASWSTVALDLEELAVDLAGQRHSEWRRRSLEQLPASAFCWRDEAEPECALLALRMHLVTPGVRAPVEPTAAEVAADLARMVATDGIEAQRMTDNPHPNGVLLRDIARLHEEGVPLYVLHKLLSASSTMEVAPESGRGLPAFDFDVILSAEDQALVLAGFPKASPAGAKMPAMGPDPVLAGEVTDDGQPAGLSDALPIPALADAGEQRGLAEPPRDRGRRLKLKELVTRNEAQWPTIARDIKRGSENGLSTAAKADGYGMYWEGAALKWAEDNGWLRGPTAPLSALPWRGKTG